MVLNSYEIMNNKDLDTQKRKYHIFKHHAWAGLGFLAVLFALRFIHPLSTVILSPIIFILIIYIVISLILTYKYRSGLYAQSEKVSIYVENENEVSKKYKSNRSKIEKKKVKAELKAKKKGK